MKRSYPQLAPDAVIAARVALVFVAVWLFSLDHPFAVAGVALTIVVIAMDGLDGYLARRLGVADELGAVLDITGDRIVEHVYWIYFAVVGVVPIWVPLLVVTRSFSVDTVRSMALATGRTPFGEKTMMRTSITRFLVASRSMRFAYGLAKVVSFVLAGSVIAMRKAAPGGIGSASEGALSLESLTLAVVVTTVALNLLRGLPVIWDSRPLLRARRAEV